MKIKKNHYVVYYRVSTKKQKQSGLGLKAQKQMVKNFMKNDPGKIISSYTEIESGKGNKYRPILDRALWEIDQDKKKRVLLVAKLDRLSRDLHFITTLQNSKVNFVCTDMPHANNLTIHVIAAIAQNERELISSRTKAALAQLKKRGKKLGASNHKIYCALRNSNESAKTNNRKSIEHAQKMKPLIKPLFKLGMTQQSVIQYLTANQVKTYRGKTKWHGPQLSRIITKWD